MDDSCPQRACTASHFPTNFNRPCRTMTPEDLNTATNLIENFLAEINKLMNRIAAVEQRCTKLEEKHEVAMRNIHVVINVVSDQSLRNSKK